MVWIREAIMENDVDLGNFFICYLAAVWPTLGHCRWGSLTNLMFITAFNFDSNVTWNFVTVLGPKAWSST